MASGKTKRTTAKNAPRKRTPPRAKAVAEDVTVKVDPKLKRLWEETRAAIARARGQGAEAFDELWEAVGRAVTHEPPLYVFGGYASPAEFFREELHEQERTARRYMRVAKFATPKEEETYGVALLDAAIGYLEAKGGRAIDGALPVAFERLRVPVGGRRVPLAEATVADVTAATRALAKSTRARGPRSATRDAMLEALKKEASLGGVRVHEANGFLSFTHIPVAALTRFLRAVSAARTTLDAARPA